MFLIHFVLVLIANHYVSEMELEQYQCRTCGERGQLVAMSDHVITAHLAEAESPFICKFDGKRFRKRPTAVKHLQQHHPHEIKQGRPYHSFLGGRRLAWDLLDTTRYLRVAPNNKRKSTPGAAVVTQKKNKSGARRARCQEKSSQ
jgi:hypothetical protein